MGVRKGVWPCEGKFCLAPARPHPHKETMKGAASKRIAKELAELTSSPPEGCSAGPCREEDLFRWSATLTGPPGTDHLVG